MKYVSSILAIIEIVICYLFENAKYKLKNTSEVSNFWKEAVPGPRSGTPSLAPAASEARPEEPAKVGDSFISADR